MLISPESGPIKKALGFLLTILIIVGAYLLLQKDFKNQSGEIKNDSQQVSSSDNKAPEVKPETPNTSESLPQNFTLKVPFTPQAPTANWDELHNEACEEASAIMANAYYNNIESIPPAIVEKQISLLTKWQQDNFGYHLSISTEETQKMIEANFSLKAEIADISVDRIKQALIDNKLVLFPANGQMLNNPNFKSPGPIYHMLVITGFDGNTFITNDPGTRKGLNYEYDYSTLEASNGNWDKDRKEVNLNDKKIIIVSKK